MSNLTLKWRILVFGVAVHVLVVAIAGFTLLLNAQYAVKVEIAAAQDSAVTLIEKLAEGFANVPPSDAPLQEFADRITQPRHVRITITPEGSNEALSVETEDEADEGEEEAAPDWFLNWVAPDIASKSVPLIASGDRVGVAEVAAIPHDEAAEVWEDVESLFFVWLFCTLALFVILMLAVDRALLPIRRLQTALERLEKGDYSVEAETMASPDLLPIAHGINKLKFALKTAEQDRHDFSRKLRDLRDSERSKLARELHDELGPCLFGLTVEADGIRDNPKEAGARVEKIGELIHRIRSTNKRILNALRPQTVGQLPLKDVVYDLIADFEERNPEATFEADIGDIQPGIDENRDLTVYRIIQEAVTNGLRHGDAERFKVLVRQKVTHAESQLLVEVRDFGKGLAADWQEGRGLLGMRERVSTENGKIYMEEAPDGGAVLTAVLPRGQALVAANDMLDEAS